MHGHEAKELVDCPQAAYLVRHHFWKRFLLVHSRMGSDEFGNIITTKMEYTRIVVIK